MPHIDQNKIYFCIPVLIKTKGAMKTKHRVTAAEEIHTQDIFPNFYTQQACKSSSRLSSFHVLFDLGVEWWPFTALKCMLAANYFILMQIKQTGVCHHIKNYGYYIMGVLQVSTKILNEYKLKRERFSLHEKGIFSLLCFAVYFPVCTLFTLTDH